jgi:cell division protein FtsI (penicillin-binding protein 3)
LNTFKKESTGLDYSNSNEANASQNDLIQRMFDHANQYSANYTGNHIHFNQMKRRMRCIALIFGLCFVIIFFRALYIQIYKQDWLSQEASKQYIKYHKAPAKRGIIYDCQKHEMAVTIDSHSVFAHPTQIQNKTAAAQKIAQILQLSKKKLYQLLSSDRQFVWIKRLINPGQAEKIKKTDIPGVHVISEPGRAYPNKTLASQVIGFTGIDGNGLEGLEYYYNSTLAGKQFVTKTKRDAYGRGFMPINGTDYQNEGKHIVLTIDQKIQYFCETILEQTVSEYQAKGAYAIVMNPSTGEVLSIAHFPTFNPNVFNLYKPSRWRNRAVTDTFEPGSTMKVFIAASALESGLYDSNSIFFCENGAYNIGRNTIHDSHPYDWLSLQQIIKHSSNIGVVKLGEKLGAKYLYKMLKLFGFGSKTDIDCPAEATGSLMKYHMWTPLDQGAICFGHGISVSGIQLLTAVSVIANGGILVKPYLVKEVLSADGNIIHAQEKHEVRRVISRQTARETRRIMATVVTPKGTGFKAALDNDQVCGKTGTSRKLKSDGTYARELYIASFLGFVPEIQPKIAILVVVDEPAKGYYGGQVAAPAFKKIAYKTLQYLSIKNENVKNNSASNE